MKNNKPKLNKELLPGYKEPDTMYLPDIVKLFSEREALRIAFVPAILTELAHGYIKRACELSVSQRISEFKKPVRELKRLVAEYEKNLLIGISRSSIERLENQVAILKEEIVTDLTKLYFSINGELKKEYPECTEYEIPTLLYMAISINTYQLLFESETDRIVKERSGKRLGSITNPITDEIIKNAKDMVSAYRIEPNGNIELSMYIISEKIAKIEFETCD